MINWLVQSMADLPALPEEAWLSPPERERLAALRIVKRRQEWLLGRWTAKRLAQTVLHQEGYGQVELQELVVTPAPDGAPELRLCHHSSSFTLHPSISHSNGLAFCALGPAGVAVGADIEQVAPRRRPFAEDFFTPGELRQIDGAPAGMHDLLTTAIWSAKEAILKALRRGLTVDTRLVECLVPLPLEGQAGWTPFTGSCDAALSGAPAITQCWWCTEADFVFTLALVAEPHQAI